MSASTSATPKPKRTSRAASTTPAKPKDGSPAGSVDAKVLQRNFQRAVARFGALRHPLPEGYKAEIERLRETIVSPSVLVCSFLTFRCV